MKLQKIKILSPLELTPVNDTFWALGSHYSVDFITDEGVLQLRNKPRWLTDLRSGSDGINWFVPKWGNPEYTAIVLMHDTAFSGWLSFELANSLLSQGMVLSGEVTPRRAAIVKGTLNLIGRSHYSDFESPLPPPYTANRKLESLRWSDK